LRDWRSCNDLEISLPGGDLPRRVEQCVADGTDGGMTAEPQIACSLRVRLVFLPRLRPSRGLRRAGPAIFGAAAGAAIGNLLGIAAAVVIALAGVFVVRRWRGGDKRA
jgi:hypothetical protein